MMDFGLYQRLSALTAKDSRSRNERIMHWTIGLCNEAGELAGLVKKAICRGQNIPELQKEIALEGGDVLWYLTQLLAEFGVTLETAAEMNIEKLKSRHPERFA